MMTNEIETIYLFKTKESKQINKANAKKKSKLTST